MLSKIFCWFVAACKITFNESMTITNNVTLKSIILIDMNINTCSCQVKSKLPVWLTVNKKKDYYVIGNYLSRKSNGQKGTNKNKCVYYKWSKEIYLLIEYQ